MPNPLFIQKINSAPIQGACKSFQENNHFLIEIKEIVPRKTHI